MNRVASHDPAFVTSGNTRSTRSATDISNITGAKSRVGSVTISPSRSVVATPRVVISHRKRPPRMTISRSKYNLWNTGGRSGRALERSTSARPERAMARVGTSTIMNATRAAPAAHAQAISDSSTGRFCPPVNDLNTGRRPASPIAAEARSGATAAGSATVTTASMTCTRTTCNVDNPRDRSIAVSSSRLRAINPETRNR